MDISFIRKNALIVNSDLYLYSEFLMVDICVFTVLDVELKVIKLSICSLWSSCEVY